MNLTNKNLQELEGYLLEAQNFMNKNYPKYKPRRTDEGYWDLMETAGLEKHAPVYERWYTKTYKALKRDLRSDLYSAIFSRTHYPREYSLLAPDGFFWGIKELEKIILEARKIYYAEKNIQTRDRSKTIAARFDYKEPNLLLVFDETQERYIIHAFRHGKPKAIIEYALSKHSLQTNKSEFRAGGPAGFTVSESLDIVMRQLLQDDKFKTARLESFISVSPTRIQLSTSPFVITTNQARKIAKQFKKIE